MSWQPVVAQLDAWVLARVGVAAAFYACTLLAMGSRLFLFAFSTLPHDEARRIRRTGAGAAGGGIGLAALQLMLQAAYLGGGAAAALDASLLGLVYDSPQGDRLILAVAGLVLLLAALPFHRHSSWPGRLLGLAGIALVLIAFVQVGHTRGEPRPVLAMLLGLHLLALAFWAAALAPLWRLAGRDAPHAGVAILRGFGRIGLVFVPALLGSGLLLAWLLLGESAALFGSAYGQLLLGKLALVVALLGLGALNKWRLVPAMALHPRAAGRALRRSIAVEAVLMAGILLLTALLTTVTAPPGGLAAIADGPSRDCNTAPSCSTQLWQLVLSPHGVPGGYVAPR
jgi:copper resistance protein D